MPLRSFMTTVFINVLEINIITHQNMYTMHILYSRQHHYVNKTTYETENPALLLDNAPKAS